MIYYNYIQLWFLLGAFCEDIKDICQSNPCLNGGSCIGSVEFYLCSCQLGYSGENCEKSTYYVQLTQTLISAILFVDRFIIHKRFL
jgi:EGF-like domain